MFTHLELAITFIYRDSQMNAECRMQVVNVNSRGQRPLFGYFPQPDLALVVTDSEIMPIS